MSEHTVAERFLHKQADAGDPELIINAQHGFVFLRQGGSIENLAHGLNAITRRMPGPQQVARVTGSVKAFNFYWSNAQAKWGVITAPLAEFPWGLDGSEFILFLGKGAFSPLGRVWTLPEMKYVAQKLGPHSGFASSYEYLSGQRPRVASLATLAEWQSYISRLAGPVLWSAVVNANTQQFADQLRDGGLLLSQVDQIIKLFIKQLLATGQKIPEGGAYDLQLLAETDPAVQGTPMLLPEQIEALRQQPAAAPTGTDDVDVALAALEAAD